MIVSLTAYQRPDYLEAVMHSFRVAALQVREPVFLVARIEPSLIQEEMSKIVGSGRGTYVTLNDEQLHCRGNTLAVLQDAWGLANTYLSEEDYVMHLEEDYLLAPDAIDMHVHMREQYRDDPEVFCTGSWTRGAYMDGQEHLLVRETNFSSQVWGTWKDRWPEIQDGWTDRTPDGKMYLGWDVNLDTHILKGRRQVRPVLARCCHIGLSDGQHTTPTIFPKTLPLVFAGVSGLRSVQDMEVGEGKWHE